MSVLHSKVVCDWCNRKIDDNDSVACRPCYEALEVAMGEFQKRAEISLDGKTWLPEGTLIKLIEDLRDFGKEVADE